MKWQNCSERFFYVYSMASICRFHTLHVYSRYIVSLFVPAIERFTVAGQIWWCKLSCWKSTAVHSFKPSEYFSDFQSLPLSPCALNRAANLWTPFFAGGGASFLYRESSDASLHTIGLVWQAMHTGQEPDTVNLHVSSTTLSVDSCCNWHQLTNHQHK